MRRALALLGLLATAAGCSLTLDTEPRQCVTDADCERFGTYPVCQQGVCVPSGLVPPNCFRGTPTTDTQIRNQCTRADCIPFDNCARLRLCDGSALPPLIPKP